MAQKLTIPYRRKREGRTDYKKRLTLLKSGLDRLVIRKSNKGFQAQIVRYEADGDKILVTARATELKKHGWNHATGNLPAAYLTGMLAAKKAKQHKITGDVIVDLGLQMHVAGSRLYAAVKGAIDGGLNVKAGEEVLPSTERATGKHIDEKLPAMVESVKKKIMS